MDPFSAIGLVANIINFVEYGYKILSVSRELAQSVTSATVENEGIEFLAIQLHGLSLDLSSGRPEAAMTADELRLKDLVDECRDISGALLLLLSRLRAKKPRSKRHAMKAMIRNMNKRDERDRLEGRLDKCRQQLHLQLSQTTRLETFSLLEAIRNSGECQAEQLRQLDGHIRRLSKSLSGSTLEPLIVGDPQGLLEHSTSALDSVVRSRVLAALWYEEMCDREESIEDAHSSTFHWLLGAPPVLKVGPGRPKSIVSYKSRTSSRTEIQELGCADSQANSEEDDTCSTLADQSSRCGASIPPAPYEEGDVEEQEFRSAAQESLTKWLSRESGILHISGKPGAGKSTLMKLLCNHPRTKEYLEEWAGSKQLIVASFYFFRHSDKSARSFKGLLRSLLHSVLSQCPDLVKDTLPAQWDMCLRNVPLHFGHKEIKHAFQKLMGNGALQRTHRLAFFIDGLDEFEGREDDLVQLLFDWVHSNPGAVKICVSSRELPIFQDRFNQCPKFQLHKLTRRDITAFVRETLIGNPDMKIRGCESQCGELIQHIVDKAEGVFLWVSLVLKAVEDGITSGDSIDSLKERVDFLPSGLEQLFRVIFDWIREKAHPLDRHRAMIIFQLLLLPMDKYHWKPRLLQLSFLDQFRSRTSPTLQRLSPWNPEKVEEQLEIWQKKVSFYCRGFVYVTRSPNRLAIHGRDIISLAHRSLASFLQDHTAVIDRETEKFDTFGFLCSATLAERRTSAAGTSRKKAIWGGSLEADAANSARILTLLYFRLPRGSLPVLGATLASLDCLIFRNVRRDPFSDPTCDVSVPADWTSSNGPSGSSALLGRSISPAGSSVAITHAIKQGLLYELWHMLPGCDIHDNLDLFLDFHLAGSHLKDTMFVLEDRRLRYLALCLSKGVSPEDKAYTRFPQQYRGAVALPTLWNLIIWSSVIANPSLYWTENIYALLLAYGATPYFWLAFDPSHGIQEFSGSIAVTGHYGKERLVRFTPIFVPYDDSPVIEFARRNGWEISFSGLVQLWYPEGAGRLQSLLARRYGAGGVCAPDELASLLVEHKFHLESWGPEPSDRPKPLFTGWKGVTRLVTDRMPWYNGTVEVQLSELPMEIFEAEWDGYSSEDTE